MSDIFLSVGTWRAEFFFPGALVKLKASGRAAVEAKRKKRAASLAYYK